MHTYYDVLILGASYGSLLGAKLLLAGHNVTLVCREGTAAAINRNGQLAGMVELRSSGAPIQSNPVEAIVVPITPVREFLVAQHVAPANPAPQSATASVVRVICVRK